jgi:guanine nucleotide-binding protein G(I)/G(S)/G(T) subunit beta-1
MKAPEGKESDADRGRIRELEQQIQDLTDKREERLDEVKGIAADLEDRAPTLKVRRTLTGHFGKVYALHWAGPDRMSTMLSASQDGKLIMWDTLSQNKLKAVALRSSWVMTCAFEQQSNGLLASGGLDNLCSIFKVDGEGSRADVELSDHDGYLSCARFISPEKILTSSGDSTIRLWDLTRKTCESIYEKHTGDVMSISLSPMNSASVFVSGSCDATVRVWDTRLKDMWCAGAGNFVAHESDVNSVEFLANGHSVISGSDDSACMLHDLRSQCTIATYNSESTLAGVTSVAASKAGRIIFAGYDDNCLSAWNVGNSESRLNFMHPNRVSSLGVNTSGEALATGCWDSLLRVFA